MSRTDLPRTLVLFAVLVVGACRATDSGSGPSGAATSTPATDALSDERRVVSGGARRGGVPFDAEFLGAVVLDNGLQTACQVDLVAVANGAYRVTVSSEHESAGCGRVGTDVVVWTYVGGQRLFSTAAAPWPDHAASITFDAEFSTASPSGVMRPATELAGEVYDPAHHKLGPGRRVEALVDDTVCGVSTTRENDDFIGFALSVVGPDSVPGCALNAPITFRVDGRRANETLANDGSLHRSFDLTVP